MKTKVFEALIRYAQMSLSLLPVLCLLRAGEWYYLRTIYTLPSFAWKTELMGLFYDLFLYGTLMLILLLPFLALSIWKRWTGILFFLLVLIPFIVSQAVLVNYFGVTLVPLDHVVFSYSIREMIMIAGSSTKISLLNILLYPALVLLCLGSIIALRKMLLPKPLFLLFYLFLCISPLVWVWLKPNPADFSNDMNYYMRVNKTEYFIGHCVHYIIEKPQSSSASIDIPAIAEAYHRATPWFRYYGSRYPFLHEENTPDVLSPYFNLTHEPPNIVFIIQESLSGYFCGHDPFFGSFTPFLDSMIDHSLYWKNCLATSERTFNVLPALFGSLPPGRGEFMGNVASIPYHFSLIRSLNENGWHSSFYYGGDPAFNGMDNFLRRQNTGFILRSFGSGFDKPAINHPDFGWGCYDADLFHRSFEVIDSLKWSPRLDIYLTLTLHSPFNIPDPEHYSFMASERTDAKGKNRDIFAAIRYTDDALRQYFAQYKNRTDFNNTIFIITGDHGLPELNPFAISSIAMYHVPLVIFSPLLKKGVRFHAVVSHLDVTPSLLAMLHNRYGVRTPQEAQWLGQGLDTIQHFHSSRTIYFIKNNKDIRQYLVNGTCFSYDRLFVLEDGMRTQPVEDPQKLREIGKKLNDFILLNDYCVTENAILPPSTFFRGSLIPETIDLFQGEEQWDSLTPIGGFYSFIGSLKFDRDYRAMQMEITFDLKSDDPDLTKYPLLVLDVFDASEKRVIWDGLEPAKECATGLKCRTWNHMNIHRWMDLSVVNNSMNGFLKIYLWNRANIKVLVKNVQVKLTGYYL